MEKIKKKHSKLQALSQFSKFQIQQKTKCISAISLLNEKLMEKVKQCKYKTEQSFLSFTIFASKPFLQQNKWLNKKVSKKSKSESDDSESDF